jgi:hypothetical protein
VLNNSPLLRSAPARRLFLLASAITICILFWLRLMRHSGDLHGLATIFYVLFVYEDYGATVVQLLILIAAIFLSARVSGRRIIRIAGERPWTVAAVAGITMAAGSVLVYHNHPLSMDEYAAYFQSQIFAAGHLAGSFPLVIMDWLIPPSFQDFFLSVSHKTGQVASGYFPGFSLILTPFTFAGIPWACNPTLSALTLVVIHRLALEIFDDTEAAGMALLLAAASPVIFGIGISYYSMPAHLLANCVYALLLVKASARRALLAGVVGSLALSLHNPVPHMLFCIPWIAWLACRQDRWRLLAALFLGYLPLCLLLGVGWFLFNQHLVHDGAAVAAGISSDVGKMASVFSLPNGAVLLARIIGIAKIWIWAVPALPILAIVGFKRSRPDTFCLLFAASALLTLGGYFFVPVDQGHGWGYRYFQSAWMALPLLATAAMFAPASQRALPRDLADHATPVLERSDTASYVIACALLTLVFGIGFRAWQMQIFMAGDLSQLPHYRGTERRIVIIDYVTAFYGGDLVQNDPWLRGNVIRMITHGPAADKQMMAQNYPTWHKVYGDRFGTVWSAAK